MLNSDFMIYLSQQMETKSILITGANGEIGHGLISHFAEKENVRVVAFDLNTLDEPARAKCYKTYTGDILDNRFLESLSTGHDFDSIYHLAALLSTRAERQPTIAHKVNVDGTLKSTRDGYYAITPAGERSEIHLSKLCCSVRAARPFD